jgi:transposase
MNGSIRSSSMRQVHQGGEKSFVDYAGTQPSIIDAATGEVILVQLFVAALGASNYTCIRAEPLAEPFVGEPRYDLERVATAEQGLYVIYAPPTPSWTTTCHRDHRGLRARLRAARRPDGARVLPRRPASFMQQASADTAKSIALMRDFLGRL